MTSTATPQLFSFESHEVHVETDEAGNPWFRAADVCPHLALDDARQAVDRVPAAEKAKRIRPTGIQNRSVTDAPPVFEWWVSEAGLYSLVLGSRKPEAEIFKAWVCRDVLPAIRKTGSYTAPGAPAAALDLRDPATLVPIASQLAQLVMEYQATITVMAPKAQAYDALISADGLTNLTQTAKRLGLKPHDFIRRLQSDGYLYRDHTRALVPYSKRVDAGYLVLRTFAANGKAVAQTLVTQAGYDHFCRKYVGGQAILVTEGYDFPRGLLTEGR